MTQSAVFLDRDGTIIRDAEYLSDPAGVELLPASATGMKQLQAAGFLLIMTTNQSGVARGYFTEDTIRVVNDRLAALLANEAASLDGIYYCPHHRKGSVPEFTIDCNCRKPRPGMIENAQKDFDIDLSTSWVVGDKLADIRFGKSKQLKTILVLTGYGEEIVRGGIRAEDQPDFIAKDLGQAAEYILSQQSTYSGKGP